MLGKLNIKMVEFNDIPKYVMVIIFGYVQQYSMRSLSKKIKFAVDASYVFTKKNAYKILEKGLCWQAELLKMELSPKKLIIHVAKNPDPSVLKLFIMPKRRALSVEFCKNNNLAGIELLIEHSALNKNAALYGALQGGHYELAKRFKDAFDIRDHSDVVGVSGNFDILYLFLSFSDHYHLIRQACRAGQFELVKHLLQNKPYIKGNKKDDSRLHRYAPTGANFESIDSIEMSVYFGASCQSGNMQLVNFLQEKCAKFTKSGISGAAIGNHYDLVKYFISVGGKLEPGVILHLFKTSKVEILKLLVDFEHINWDDALNQAIVGKNLPAIDYAFENGAVLWPTTAKLPKKVAKHLSRR